jgi:hypothetical protein
MYGKIAIEIMTMVWIFEGCLNCAGRSELLTDAF